MYQSGRVGDEAKKRKSPTKSGRVGIYVFKNVVSVWKALFILCLASEETMHTALVY